MMHIWTGELSFLLEQLLQELLTHSLSPAAVGALSLSVLLPELLPECSHCESECQGCLLRSQMKLKFNCRYVEQMDVREFQTVILK